jgi:hypothetical protein
MKIVLHINTNEAGRALRNAACGVQANRPLPLDAAAPEILEDHAFVDEE